MTPWSITMKIKNLVVLLLFCLAALCIAATDTRPPAVAGSFYPADPRELSAEINKFLEAASPGQFDGTLLGLVVPHAGYQFSAPTAAFGYKLARNKQYDLIVVIAPSHREAFTGATIYPGHFYETPLGKIAVDHDLAAQFAAFDSYIKLSEQGHHGEHAVEVQVPFIQTLFPDTPILPMVVGAYDWKMCKQIGESLANVLKDKKALIIASSDLYHGYSYDDCNRSDKRTLDAVVDFKPERFCQGLLNEKYQACGGAPITIMQVAVSQMGANHAQLLAHTNSNDVTGNQGGYVVGYGAVALGKETGKIEYPAISRDTQISLLKMARQSIKTYLTDQTIPEFTPENDEMLGKRGVFVTLTINGQLRGCIGHHESDMPLYQLVPYLAVSAAVNDPRFAPLSLDELENVRIKISVYLTNVYKIDSLDEFKMGTDGIILRKGNKGATYLPEVPVEAGWTTVAEEMKSLCRKAGLPANAWKDGAEFWIYRTMVFDESLLK